VRLWESSGSLAAQSSHSSLFHSPPTSKKHTSTHAIAHRRTKTSHGLFPDHERSNSVRHPVPPRKPTSVACKSVKRETRDSCDNHAKIDCLHHGSPLSSTRTSTLSARHLTTEPTIHLNFHFRLHHHTCRSSVGGTFAMVSDKRRDKSRGRGDQSATAVDGPSGARLHGLVLIACVGIAYACSADLLCSDGRAEGQLLCEVYTDRYSLNT
jgi:hypothetical protein